MRLPWLFRRLPSALIITAASTALGGASLPGRAQAALPPTAPTRGDIAPLAGTSNTATDSGSRPHAARVSCSGGQLTVAAQDSSLNQILRAVARCTGMRITGGVPEQRVFGNYGPAAPATVLATLLDGTGSNMLLKETVADQPAELILTPRTGGPTPPSAPAYAATQEDEAPQSPDEAPPQAVPLDSRFNGLRRGLRPGAPIQNSGNAGSTGNQTPVLQPNNGSVVTGPPSLPQPINNVNGSPNNVSPTPGTYPTTDSVPLDAVATPSTTPSTSGIVDAPNPPPAGSDTAAALNGAPKGTPGTTNIDPSATSATSTPGATNTTVPVQGQTSGTGQAAPELTPEQVFQQLQQQQQLRQQQQQQSGSPQ